MKIDYRPEIDGLRAIAVGAIILYHARLNFNGFEPFKGGFIGVDIFFVISGYLITSIILRELVNTGHFSFKQFYKRRIRRIVPALLFVIITSLPFAWIYLLPNSFIDFSKSIIYSLGFSSNFYFHYSGQVYGAESGLVKPFLHTWSLSIEEQFYILFPIILIIIFKYSKKYLIYYLITLFIFSLFIADFDSRNNPSFNFYILHSRAWELLAGSILSYYEIKKGSRSKNNILNLILPITGILLIIHSIIFFDDKMFHPSFYTLSPVIGAVLIIWFSNNNEIITKLLSTKLFVGVGLISYSLYLWHYPIFAFSVITEFTQGNILRKILLGIIILMLSIFSYYLIEKPFRNKNNNFRFISIIILILSFFILIFNLISVLSQGYKNRFDIDIQTKSTYRYLTDKNELCFGNINFCKFNTDKKNKIYLIGDSHLASLSYNLKSLIKNYQFIPITEAGYFFFDDKNIISIDKYTKKLNTKFVEFNNIVNEELKNSVNNIIIFGGSTSLYFFKKRYINRPIEWRLEFVEKNNLKFNTEKLQNTFFSQLKKLTENNIVILIYPIPEMGTNIFNKNLKDLKSFQYTYDNYKIVNKEVIDFFDTIKLNNLIKIKPSDVLCDKVKNLCPIVDKKNMKLIFSDPWHPSLKGSELINDLLIKKIEKIKFENN